MCNATETLTACQALPDNFFFGGVSAARLPTMKGTVHGDTRLVKRPMKKDVPVGTLSTYDHVVATPTKKNGCRSPDSRSLLLDACCRYGAWCSSTLKCS